jgi:hypothetical protein
MITTRRAAALAVSAAFAVVPASALAGNSDKATGGGSSPGNATTQAGGVAVPFSFTLTAQNTAAPKGQFTFTRPDGSFSATVTCFTESGNQAALSGPISSGSGVFTGFEGQYAYFGVMDNGEGSTATAPDAIQVDIGGQYTNSCPISTLDPYQVTGGNIQVHQG